MGSRPAQPSPRRSCYDVDVVKLLLLSIILSTALVPAYAARVRQPERALRWLMVLMFLAEFGYAFFLFFLYRLLV